MNWLREPDAEPIPGYRLVEPLGTGGFGEVWKCIAPGGIHKAIKFVYGNLNSLDGDAVKAEQELKALERVKEVRHPFVLSMDRIEVVSGELVIVMELADKSLHDLAEEYQRKGQPGVPRDELLAYLRDTADGLDHLIDRHNLQHLDVKPRNLFLIADRVKVADFGLVKHLERGSSSGLMGGVSPLYAAPETFTGKVSRHSDQYSLAVVYMELLAGVRPFKGRNIRQLAMQHMSEQPDLSGLPEADKPAVARALAKDPNQRYPNCLAFVRALVGGGRSEGGGTGPRSISNLSLAELQLEKLGPSDAEPGDGLMATSLPASVIEAALAAEGDPSLGATISGEVGVLRPTLLIGVGGLGRRALIEVRTRLLDRFGDLAQVPAVRFLYIDSDPDADRKAASGPPDVAMNTADVFPLQLQPVGNYRRRMLEFLSDWLPREKLYTIPRSLQPMGSRALGRLAFCDHFLRLQVRLKRELQIATHPEALSQSVSHTGLSLRDAAPRVFVFAGAGGGSAGLLADLGYTLRRVIGQQQVASSPVVAVLIVGAPHDPATPPPELANVYATLTELNHFHTPGVSFSTQYGPDGPRLSDHGRPYSSIYLLPLADRSSASLQQAMSHLANYVAQDVATPLGARLDHTRKTDPRPDCTPFRSFGTVGVWYPRGLLLRVAARQCCFRLIQLWQSSGAATSPAAVEMLVQQAVNDPNLRWESLAVQLDRAAAVTPEGQPSEVLRMTTAELERQISVLPGPEAAAWAVRAMDQVRDCVGGKSVHSSESLYRKSRAHRALTQASQQVAEQWENHVSALLFPLMDYPGRRVATTEAAFQRLVRYCEQAASEQRRRLDEQTTRTRDAYANAQQALDNCRAGGFSLFGPSTRPARAFLEQLAVFARQRLAEEFLHAGVQFWRSLQGRLEERLRDLGFCRQRLRHLQPLLSTGVTADPPSGVLRGEQSPSPGPVPDPLHEAMQGSSNLRVVLPDGETDLEEAAAQFVRTLDDADWGQLEELLQGLVLTPLGGLVQVCQRGGDLLRYLAGPLIDQASEFLGTRLPVTDVASVQMSAAERGTDVTTEVEACHDAAAPLLPGPASSQSAYLLVPGSDAGDEFGRLASAAVPALKVVRGIGQTDLTFCREQGYLPPGALAAMLKICRPAYDHQTSNPASSPHARFDIHEWVPLDL
jgi:hypothetical protein